MLTTLDNARTLKEVSFDNGSYIDSRASAIVRYEGAGVVFDLPRMRIGHGYSLEVEGTPMVVVRRRDGTIDLFEIPAK